MNAPSTSILTLVLALYAPRQALAFFESLWATPLIQEQFETNSTSCESRFRHLRIAIYTNRPIRATGLSVAHRRENTPL